MTYDVIIVGGGIAGLSAAHTLTQLNRKVGLFESNQNLGGRILSLHLKKGISFEAGALMIQGPLLELLRKHHIKMTPLSEEKSETFDTHGKPLQFQALQQSLAPEYQAALKLIREAKQRFQQKHKWGKSALPRMTEPLLSEVLHYSKQKDKETDAANLPSTDTPAYWAQKLISATLRAHTGAEINHVSLLELMASESDLDHNLKPCAIQGGMDTLITTLHHQANATLNLTTHLKTPIVKIQNNFFENIVSVFDEKGQSYQAKAVILALPFSILKHNKIQFTPELSSKKRNALRHFGVSHYNNVIIEFENIFWNKDVHYLFPNGPTIEDWPQYVNGHFLSNGQCPFLIAQYAGKFARFGTASDREILEKALLPLKRVYGESLPNVKFFYVSRFDTDPNILGGSLYCSHLNKPEDFENLSNSENGLYFAGDYLYPKKHGTLDAAFEAGMQRALEVDAYLQYKMGVRPKL